MNQIKSTIILSLFFVLSISVVKSQNKTDTILQFPNEAVIAADNMNVLYIGMENPISVAVPGEKLEDITISCSDGADVRMVSFGHYIAVAYPKATDIYITTMVKGMYKGYTHFRVKTKPVPAPSFGNITSHSASLQDILAQDSIYAKIDADFPLANIKYTVTNYTLIYTPKGSNPKYFVVQGGDITQTIKNGMKDAKIGDTIMVFGITAAGPGTVGLIRLPSAIAIVIE